MNKRVVAALVSAMALLGSVELALANLPNDIAVQERLSARRPERLGPFCLVNPGACRTDLSSAVAFDDGLMRLLSRVNARVNRTLRSHPDVALKAARAATKSVDCESYAINKRQELIRAGLPAEALRIAFLRTLDGGPRAVLVVKTRDGDLALEAHSGQINFLQEAVTIDPHRWG